MLRGDDWLWEHTQSQGGYVNEKMVLGSFLANEHATLDGSAVSDGFVWVDVFANGLSEELLEHGLNLMVIRKVHDGVKGLEAINLPLGSASSHPRGQCHLCLSS
jgi:hypothetical protein